MSPFEQRNRTAWASDSLVDGAPDNGCTVEFSRPAPYSKKVDNAEASKASNPKDAISGSKVPMHLAPFTAIMAMAVGLAHGMLKYGRMNWRKAGVRYSVYLDAIQRHALDLAEGNDRDEDGCCNLAAILANAAILVDARAAGKLTDDRNVRGADFTAFKKRMETEYARLKALHADKDPKHFTIADN